MRILATILFLTKSLVLSAEQFTVFEKDGRYGLRDDQGEVTVPPVYEQLGWSTGSTEVFEGVIGFREGRLWGLISARNKALTDQQFYTLEPFNEGLIKGSVKGRFSNQLFHGLLDNKGEIRVSFHYFSIDAFEENYLISQYNSRQLKFGVTTSSNQILVPIKYDSIIFSNDFYVTHFGYSQDLYRINGALIQENLDSLMYDEGWKCYRNGFAGFIGKLGDELYPFDYKDFEIHEGILFPLPFPKWIVYDHDEKVFEVSADSLSRYKDESWITFYNGGYHLKLTANDQVKHGFQLHDFFDEYLIVENSKTKEWSVIDDSGQNILAAYDSIFLVGKAISAKQDEKWTIHNSLGEKISNLPLEYVKPSIESQCIVRVNGYWGIMNESGEQVTRLKYDSIILDEGKYKVQYLNRWGVMNKKGEWLVRPEFTEVIIFNDYEVGRKGRGFTIFVEGVEQIKTTSMPVGQLEYNLVVKDHNQKYGLIDRWGMYLFHPQFDSISVTEGFFKLRKGSLEYLSTASGQLILKEDSRIQSIGNYSDNFFPIKMDNRWGFIDSKGRLRISNRYEDARSFSEGIAPIKLRGKWGFIDLNESLIVQPFYQEVGAFYNGLCIVESGGKKGLIDMEGNEVIRLDWLEITRLTTGNYKVKDERGKVGLVSSRGSFILRPAYEELEDTGGRVIVTVNGKVGLLDYQGRQLHKIAFNEIKIFDDFTLLKY